MVVKEKGYWCKFLSSSCAVAILLYLILADKLFAIRLCTGGTLTMAPSPEKDHALAPVPGALTDYLKSMVELTNDNMPDVVVHEYCPLLDSSDMGEYPF